MFNLRYIPRNISSETYLLYKSGKESGHLLECEGCLKSADLGLSRQATSAWKCKYNVRCCSRGAAVAQLVGRYICLILGMGCSLWKLHRGRGSWVELFLQGRVDHCLILQQINYQISHPWYFRILYHVWTLFWQENPTRLHVFERSTKCWHFYPTVTIRDCSSMTSS